MSVVRSTQLTSRHPASSQARVFSDGVSQSLTALILEKLLQRMNDCISEKPAEQPTHKINRSTHMRSSGVTSGSAPLTRSQNTNAPPGLVMR